MSALQDLLNTYRNASASEREKGTYFEELIRVYLRNEATYRDLSSDVWAYADWAKAQNLDAEDYKLQKKDIDSFFTASGKKPFTRRIIVATTDHWSDHAEDALRDQQPPVSKIDLNDLLKNAPRSPSLRAPRGERVAEGRVRGALRVTPPHVVDSPTP